MNLICRLTPMAVGWAERGTRWARALLRPFEALLPREHVLPTAGLAFASAVSVALVIARMAWTGNARYAFLIWNLFLAWLPLGLAFLACRQMRPAAADRQTTPRRLRLFACCAAWLLFFPNAPYIFTDIIHLTRGFYHHFWVDLTLVLSCAVAGLVAGFLSLHLMQSMVARLYGRLVSWLFIAAVAGLSGLGIYIGRFLRFNSWDILFRPVELLRGVGHWAANPFANSTSGAFPILFAVFLFLSYVTLYGLTHLRPVGDPDPQSRDLPLPRTSPAPF